MTWMRMNADLQFLCHWHALCVNRNVKPSIVLDSAKVVLAIFGVQ